MNKKVKSLIIGAAVALVLLGVLAYLLLVPPKAEENPVSSSQSSAPAVSSTTKRLYEGDPADVVSIAIEGDKTGSYEIVRDGDTFAIEEFEGLAQLTSSYDSLVDYYADITVARTVNEAPDDLSIYGLDDPVLNVTVTYKDGSSHEIRYGDMMPTSDGYYLQIDDDSTVYAVSTTIFNNSNVVDLYYLDPEILDQWEAPTDKEGNALRGSPIIDYLIINGGALGEYGTFRMENIPVEELTSSYASTYRITEPVEADFRVRSDSEGNDQNLVYIDGFIQYSAKCGVAIPRPTEEDLTACGFDEPTATIDFSREGEPHFWTFGNLTTLEDGTQAYYMMADDLPSIYLATVDQLPWLTAKIEDLFSRLRLLPMINDVESIDLYVQGTEYEITCEGESDTLVAYMNGKEVKTANYRKFYQYLLSAPAEELNIDNEPGEKIASITYNYYEGGSENLTFYDVGNRRCIISLNGDKIFLCRTAYVDTLARNCQKLLNGEVPTTDF